MWEAAQSPVSQSDASGDEQKQKCQLTGAYSAPSKQWLLGEAEAPGLQASLGWKATLPSVSPSTAPPLIAAVCVSKFSYLSGHILIWAGGGGVAGAVTISPHCSWDGRGVPLSAAPSDISLGKEDAESATRYDQVQLEARHPIRSQTPQSRAGLPFMFRKSAGVRAGVTRMVFYSAQRPFGSVVQNPPAMQETPLCKVEISW